jgi:peptidoglycan/LPS O-acetylase OafA/YrhL
MYISHFVFVWLAVELFRKFRFNLGEDVSAILAFVFVVVFSTLFSKISYNLIEVYFIRIGKNLANFIYSGNNKPQLKGMEFSGLNKSAFFYAVYNP